MEIFEKLSDVANKTCKYTTEKTNKLTSIAKYKWKMNNYKCKIDDLYEELGKIVYENNVREDMKDYEEKKEQTCAQINELASKVETCRKKILKLNDKRQCQNCYTEIDREYSYCPNCGESQNSILQTTTNNEEYEESYENQQIDVEDYINPDKIKNNYTEGEETKRVEED